MLRVQEARILDLTATNLPVIKRNHVTSLWLYSEAKIISCQEQYLLLPIHLAGKTPILLAGRPPLSSRKKTTSTPRG